MKKFFTLLTLLTPIVLSAQNVNWHHYAVSGKIPVKDVIGTLKDNAPDREFFRETF